MKCLLNGLTLFLISTGIRVAVSFEELTEEDQAEMRVKSAHFMAAAFGVCYTIGGFLMHYIHTKHQDVFRMNYNLLTRRHDDTTSTRGHTWPESTS